MEEMPNFRAAPVRWRLIRLIQRVVGCEVRFGILSLGSSILISMAALILISAGIKL